MFSMTEIKQIQTKEHLAIKGYGEEHNAKVREAIKEASLPSAEELLNEVDNSASFFSLMRNTKPIKNYPSTFFINRHEIPKSERLRK